MASSGGDHWYWTNPILPPGSFTPGPAHKSELSPEFHQHYFWGATQPLVARANDRLFTMVHVNADHPPEELMLQFYDGAWEHRVFWGDDRIDWGAPSSPSRFRAGGIPASGEWVRLEVAAASLGLAGVPISGMAFGCFGGEALWDYSGVCRVGTDIRVTPNLINLGRPVDVTITTADTATGLPVAGIARISNFTPTGDPETVEVPTNVPFTQTFRTTSKRQPGWPPADVYMPGGTATFPNSDFNITIPFRFNIF